MLDQAHNFRHGQRVLELGGDGSTLYITGFERDGDEEYRAVCLKLGSDQVLRIPVSFLKPSHQDTIH
jgi:hypothetical protein